jgi:hypothetical protein
MKKLVVFAVSLLSIPALSYGADQSFQVGNFRIPSKEVLECSAVKLVNGIVNGEGTLVGHSKTFDMSIPGPFGPNTSSVRLETLLETDGVKIGFTTYDSGITMFVVPSGKKMDEDSNWLAQAGTSLGPIRDSRDQKLFLTYDLPNGAGRLMASCSYATYDDSPNPKASDSKAKALGSDSSLNASAQSDAGSTAAAAQ